MSIIQEGQAYLTMKQAAIYLGTTVRWMKANIHQRNIPHSRLGRQYRFKPSALDQWLGNS